MCEFITAGGFNHADLPENLVQEGALMRDALLRDLSQLPYQISTTVDARLAVPSDCHKCFKMHADDDAWVIWEQQIKQADAVWLIAPETDGLLKKLTQLAVQQGKLILGCGLQAIEIASYKLATYLALNKAGIVAVPSYTLDSWPKQSGRWVLKPDDGAGCADMLYFENSHDLTDYIKRNNQAPSHVIQPYQEGVAASISCVMHLGQAQLLSCNKQMVTIKDNRFNYSGSQINGIQRLWHEFERLAQKIAASNMDLNGYIGIDVIVKADDSIVVVEINPRLTTSYVGLAQAIGHNPAALVLNTLTQAHFKWPVLQRHILDVYV